MTATYLPGDLATYLRGDGVVLAPGDRLAEVAALEARTLDRAVVAEVLSRGVPADVPDFAAVRLVGTEVHVAVRGAFVVSVDGFLVDGSAASEGTEWSAEIPAGGVVEVLPVGTTRTGLALPLTGGVVRSNGVTWRPTAPSAPVDRTVEPAAAPPVPPAPASEYTVVRTPPEPVAASAPPPPVAPPAPPPPVEPPVEQSVEQSVEHDGRTITPAQLQALRAGQAPPPAAPAPPPPVGIQQLRPLVALQLSSGRVVQVRRRVLIGRSPRVQQVGGSANLPALVTVDDPYVSSTHLEVAFDGVRVTVTDTSTNGTLLAHQGRAPLPLDHGVPTEIAIGDVLTLSKGLTATVVPAPDQV